ncbi:hypothetical protein BDF22DRAFT_516464 [Syncephalis plumigaleata]|nr:hypothetical protein BDF22DRAFT_516464 [Syncephalis plumigaleata]
MPVPFEALLPLGVIIGMVSLTGIGLRAVKTSANGSHNPRYNIDNWDQSMMRRDERLTGSPRGQQVSDKGIANASIQQCRYTFINHVNILEWMISTSLQSNEKAPEEFSVNSIWYAEKVPLI